MNHDLRRDADAIIRASIEAVLPDAAVRRALENAEFPGRVLLVAAGKAAWQMAKTAADCLGERLDRGVVVTKYDHVKGDIPHCECVEAGHPVPDENSFLGTQKAIDLVTGLKETDTVLFLLSGGYVDGDTATELRAHGLTVDAVLKENDAYHALQKTGGLIITGATGTDVNDVAVALLRA
ncbi:MAG: DUF4147 domain-containing protein [Clostridia bacterium]|nr:DUF4147 domain-containing protein [Clostridia bacterium]